MADITTVVWEDHVVTAATSEEPITTGQEVTLVSSAPIGNQTGMNSLRLDFDYLEIDPDASGQQLFLAAEVEGRADANSKWRLIAAQSDSFRFTGVAPNRVIIVEPGVFNPEGVDISVAPVDDVISKVSRQQFRMTGDQHAELRVIVKLKDKNNPTTFASVKIDAVLTLYNS